MGTDSGRWPLASGTGRSYTDRTGEISIFAVPDQEQLGRYTRQVRQNKQVLPAGALTVAEGDNPIPKNRGQQGPIKHVFYIIKENRTYDQVFGDMPRGNGDRTLVQFGRVTPNLHALADQFILLDNYYGPGDQSALGHRWCLQAYANDWIHKYSNGRNDQNPMLLAATDAIYDNAKANGVSVHSFGERGLNTLSNPNATWTDIYFDWKNGTSNVKITPFAEIIGLRDIYDMRYPAYELRVPDQYRADIFLQQFAQWEQSNTLPSFVMILLPQDHTNGTAPGYPTPRAMNADNDLAVGRVVEAISHSKDWGSSAIFITEDDSQDGTDHVDGHRTVGMVISPWVLARSRGQQSLHNPEYVSNHGTDSGARTVESV
jgi:phospholipase C